MIKCYSALPNGSSLLQVLIVKAKLISLEALKRIITVSANSLHPNAVYLNLLWLSIPSYNSIQPATPFCSTFCSMLWQMKVIVEKPVWILVGKIRASHTRTERVPVFEKNHVLRNDFDVHKIGLVIHWRYH